MRAMLERRTLLLLSALAFGQAACSNGCGASDDKKGNASMPAPSPPSGRDASALPAGSAGPVWPPNPALRRMPGMAATLLRGAHELELTDDEKTTITKVEATLVADEGGDGGISAATSTFMSTLASGIHAGKLDAAKLAADYAAIDRANAALQAKEVAAIVGLHDALPPAQRHALTAFLREKRAKHERMAQAMPPVDSGSPDFVKSRVERLTRDLSLDVDGGQQAKVEAVVAANAKSDPTGPAAYEARRDEANKRIDGILAAFDGDTLDVGALSGAAKSSHEGAERTATYYAQLLPLLKPDQREKLAEKVMRVGSRPGRFAEDNPLGGGLEGPAEEPPTPPMPR
jgi:hypothetical protein